MKKLDELIAAGAILTMPDGYRALIADATIIGGDHLWFYAAFEREHFIDFDAIEEAGIYLNFRRDLFVAATVGPLEGEEDEAELAKWKAYIDGEDGRVHKLSIEAMKKGAIDWNKHSKKS